MIDRNYFEEVLPDQVRGFKLSVSVQVTTDTGRTYDAYRMVAAHEQYVVLELERTLAPDFTIIGGSTAADDYVGDRPPGLPTPFGIHGPRTRSAMSQPSDMAKRRSCISSWWGTTRRGPSRRKEDV